MHFCLILYKFNAFANFHSLLAILFCVQKMDLSTYILFVSAISSFKSVFTMELMYDRIELLNDPYLEGIYNFSEFRITKFNRTAYVFNSNFEFLMDFNDDFEIEVEFYYNRFNNNQYTKSLVNLKRTTICKAVEKHRNTMFSESNKEKTNYLRRDKDYCPLIKVDNGLAMKCIC